VKIPPVGAELFHPNGGTDRHDDINSRFPQSCIGLTCFFEELIINYV